MVGLKAWRSEPEPLERRPPAMGAEPGSWSWSAANPFVTEGGGEPEVGVLEGTFLRMSS